MAQRHAQRVVLLTLPESGDFGAPDVVADVRVVVLITLALRYTGPNPGLSAGTAVQFSRPVIRMIRFQLRDSGRLCPLDWWFSDKPL
jgi:hypothetical protein